MGRGKPQTPSQTARLEAEDFQVLQCYGEHAVIAQVNAIEKRLFSRSLTSTGAVHQQLARRNTVLLYAYVRRGAEEAVLGYIVYQTNSVVCHIQNLAVHPDHRRQGIASTLLLAALQKAVGERRVQEALLHVAAGNAPALRLYRRVGFEDRAQVDDYYGLGRPALRMTCDLDPETNPAWATAAAASGAENAPMAAAA